jgi:hypothetical protein
LVISSCHADTNFCINIAKQNSHPRPSAESVSKTEHILSELIAEPTPAKKIKIIEQSDGRGDLLEIHKMDLKTFCGGLSWKFSCASVVNLH